MVGITLRTFVLALIVLMTVSQICKSDWRGWRGVEQQGRSYDANGPTHWSQDSNTVWKTSIPGTGWSSPIVSGNSVYLTTAYPTRWYAWMHRTSHWAQYLLALIAAVAAARQWVFVSQGSISNERSNCRTQKRVLYAVALTAVCVYILFGKQSFGAKGPVFTWIVSAGVLCVCLTLAALSSRNVNTKAICGYTLAVLSFVFAFECPDLTAPRVSEPKSDWSYFEEGMNRFAIVGVPTLFLGIWLSVCGDKPSIALPHMSLARHRLFLFALATLGGALMVIEFVLAVDLPTLAVVVSNRLAMISVQPTYGWGPTVLLIFVGTVLLYVNKTQRGMSTDNRLVYPLILLGFMCFLMDNQLVSPASHHTRAVVCVSAEHGQIEWVAEVGAGPMEHKYVTSCANATPVTDGSNVYAYFGNNGLVSIDSKGNRNWTCTDLPYLTIYGNGSSPVLFNGKVLLLCESDTAAYVAAVDCVDGTLVWKTERTQSIHPIGSGNCRTPVVAKIGERDTLIVWGFKDITGYDPDTGKVLWTHAIQEVGGDCVASLVHDQERIYLVGPAICMAIAKSGLESPQCPIQWSIAVRGPTTPTPLLFENSLYMVSDDGIVTCLDCRTGKRLWRYRVGGNHYASPVALGDMIYFCDRAGKTTVFAASSHADEQGSGDVCEEVNSTFAPVSGDWLIRTTMHLMRISRTRRTQL